MTEHTRKKNLNRVNVRLPDSDHEKLLQLAIAFKTTSLAETLRRCFEYYLNSQKGEEHETRNKQN